MRPPTSPARPSLAWRALASWWFLLVPMPFLFTGLNATLDRYPPDRNPFVGLAMLVYGIWLIAAARQASPGRASRDAVPCGLPPTPSEGGTRAGDG